MNASKDFEACGDGVAVFQTGLGLTPSDLRSGRQLSFALGGVVGGGIVKLANLFGRQARRIAVAAIIAIFATSYGPTASAENNKKVTFFILDGTVEPLSITRPGNPMAGGIITELVELIFADSEYEIVPKVMPWKRLAVALREDTDWIIYGFPGGFGPDIPYEFATTPVLSFNHVAITLRSNDFNIRRAEDVFDRTAILVENFHYPGLDPHLKTHLDGRGSGKISSIRAFKPQGALRMLRHRRGDVVFGYQARMLYQLHSAGLTLEDVRFQDASKIIPTNSMYISYSPNMPEAAKQFINARLTLFSNDGRLAKIVAKYSGPADLLQ